MSDARVSPRERLVLTAIIELYIATGEPVASQAVARRFSNQEGLSSATIRNVMATLGEAGLLEQPHTSSAGFRPRGLSLLRRTDYAAGPHGLRRTRPGSDPMPQGSSSLGPLPMSEAGAGRSRKASPASPAATTIWSAPRMCWRFCPAAWAWRWPLPPESRCWNIFIFRGFQRAVCSLCW